MGFLLPNVLVSVIVLLIIAMIWVHGPAHAPLSWVLALFIFWGAAFRLFISDRALEVIYE